MERAPPYPCMCEISGVRTRFTPKSLDASQVYINLTFLNHFHLIYITWSWQRSVSHCTRSSDSLHSNISICVGLQDMQQFAAKCLQNPLFRVSKTLNFFTWYSTLNTISCKKYISKASWLSWKYEQVVDRKGQSLSELRPRPSGLSWQCVNTGHSPLYKINVTIDRAVLYYTALTRPDELVGQTVASMLKVNIWCMQVNC